MESLFDPDALPSVRARFASLEGDVPPRWGKMTAPQMVCHMKDVLDIALGEAPVVPIETFPLTLMRLYPFRWLFAYRLPWPKGMPTAPEMQRTRPGSWAADVDALLDAVERAVARGDDPKAVWGVHPLLGPLTACEWGPLVYKHLDHHLTQFGV